MESNNYCEVLVKVQTSKVEEITQRVLWIFSWALLVLNLFLLFGAGLFNVILWVVWLVTLIVALVWKRRMSVEYEYQYLDGSLRIDRIIAMKKRKKCGRFEIENLYVMAPEGDEQLQPYLSREGFKPLDYSSRSPEASNRYQLVFPNQLVTIEPTEAMVRLMWRSAPNKVIRKRAVVG